MMIKNATKEYHPPKERRSLVAALLELLPVAAIVGIDIALVFSQYALLPYFDVKSTVDSAAQTNTAWVLHKITMGGGVVLGLLTLRHLFLTQSMTLLIFSAVGLLVHLATALIVEPALLIPFIATYR